MSYTNTNESIRNSCIKFGAKVVYEAGGKRLEGDMTALPFVNLDNGDSLGEANNIMTVAFGLMGAVDRAADLTDVIIGLAKVGGDK